MSVLYSILSLLLSFLFTFSNGCTFLTNSYIKAKDPDNLKLSFSVISDTHITDSEVRTNVLAQGLRDMSNAKTPLDAVVMAGDLTNDGEVIQYDKFFGTVKQYANIPNKIFAMGNHDTWSDDGFLASDSNFINGYNALTGSTIDKVYYSTTVNGFTFIVMGSESDGVDAYISEEQISWLDSQLSWATQGGKPAFVICHQPINGMNGQDAIWDEGGIGEQSDAVLAVLKKYQNVFYISGHLHAGFSGNITKTLKGYSSVETVDSINYINLPCYTYLNSEAGNIMSGCGYVFEIYEGKVLIRARNFVLGDWYPCYNAEIAIG